MPLLDHFRPPLFGNRHWESFHARWGSSIADALNLSLPEGYFAEEQVHATPRIEVDVAAFEGRPANGAPRGGAGGGGVAMLEAPAAQLAAADLVIPAPPFPPGFAVAVYETSAVPTLVAAIELVSPGNKDRPEHRRALTVKCAAYLQRAVGLIVIDTVTVRQSRPFEELLAEIAPGTAPPFDADLSAASFRPVRLNAESGECGLEVRARPLTVGGVLPALPLALGGLGHVMVDFEATYEEVRARRRL